MGWVDRFLEKMRQLLEAEAPELSLMGDSDDVDREEWDAAERAVSMHNIYEQLWAALTEVDRETGTYNWPVDMYVDDDGSLFAIVAQDGKLYRVGLTIDEGANVTLGEWVQVMETFTPVTQARTTFTVRRQADGRYRWLMIAATAVLNRVGEIDSAELFDSFVAYAAETGERPRLDFYHAGVDNPELWEFGTADYQARDGVVYVVSGLFDDEHPLAAATITAAQRDPGKWGASIEFRAFGEAEMVAVGSPPGTEVSIPVYRRGKNTRISVVLESDAAGWFTNLGISQEVYRMRPEIRAKLLELYGGDEEQVQAFVDQFGEDVDRVNRMVDEEGLIHRQEGDAPAADEDAEVIAGEDDETTGGQDIEIDDEVVVALTRAVVESEALVELRGHITDLAAMLDDLRQRLDTDQVRLGKVDEALGRVGGRLEKLERTERDKQHEWLEDLPERPPLRVTYRPRGNGDGGEDEIDETSEAQANKVLAHLPQY